MKRPILVDMQCLLFLKRNALILLHQLGRRGFSHLEAISLLSVDSGKR